jgi:hypothetical protein
MSLMINVLISDINFEHAKTNSSKKLVFDLINSHNIDNSRRVFLIATHKYKSKKEKNIRKIFVPLYKSRFYIFRFLAEIYFNLYSSLWLIKMICLRHEISLAVVSPSIFACIPLFFAKILRIKNRYLIQRDLYYNNFNFSNYFSLNFFMYKMSLLLFKLSICNASKVGFENSSDLKLAEILHKSHNFKFEVLFNWYKREHLNRHWAQRKVDKHIRFIYTGNLGVAQNLEQIIDILGSVFPDPNSFSCDIYGNGDQLEPFLIKLSKSTENFQYKGHLEPNILAKLLDSYDYGIISLNSKKILHNIPGKLMYYLDSSLPVVCITNEQSYLSKFVEKSFLGLYINAYSSKSSLINYLNEERHNFARNLDLFFDDLDPDNIPKKIWSY